jgi:glycosyltransferase involved in cell wall biosynthesis
MFDSGEPRVAALIPIFNNAGTLAAVLQGVLAHLDDVLVVDDGSSDGTPSVLEDFAGRIRILRHHHNVGKGAALVHGFRTLLQAGFTHALALDGDGQHVPGDIPLFLKTVARDPSAVIIGRRNMRSAGAPLRSRVGLVCSNWLLRQLAGIELSDSQAGFRAYPLRAMEALDLEGRRYDLEIEVLIKAAWRGIPIEPIDIDVRYGTNGDCVARDGASRVIVSHFRPWADTLLIGRRVTQLALQRSSRNLAPSRVGGDVDAG